MAMSAADEAEHAQAAREEAGQSQTAIGNGAGRSDTTAGERSPATRKQVQVVGAPPPHHGNGRKDDQQSSGTHSDGEDGEDEEDEEEGQGHETGQDGSDSGEEIDDADLLSAFDDDEEVIDLTHLRLTSRSLRKMPLHRFTKLQRLCLRQNEISKISEKDVGTLSELRDLDLYDNALGKTYGESLRGCPRLESLDLSFNDIHHISHLSHLANLHTLYLVQNKISRVRTDDLAPPLGSTLKSLELGGNRIRVLENIGHLHQLEELWVGKNKITKLEGLSQLSSLRVLSIQSNRITKLENLEQLHNLEELYLSHNGLEKIEGLEKNLKLTTLDVAANKIKEIENVGHLKHLEEFWANDNQIETLNQLENQLGPNLCPDLNTVYLEGNPAQKAEGANYRRKVKLALPQVKQIDATFVR